MLEAPPAAALPTSSSIFQNRGSRSKSLDPNGPTCCERAGFTTKESPPSTNAAESTQTDTEEDCTSARRNSALICVHHDRNATWPNGPSRSANASNGSACLGLPSVLLAMTSLT